jgi:hypothetical protein
MSLVAHRPDLAVAVALDPYAPRVARNHVAQVGHPSPDLRNTLMLLVSDLVTGAAEASTGETIELRVWMPNDLARIEIQGRSETIERGLRHLRDHALLLLEKLSDRWRLEHSDDSAWVWFEIDRQ